RNKIKFWLTQFSWTIPLVTWWIKRHVLFTVTRLIFHSIAFFLLESALMGIFEPMPCVKDGVQCAAFVCHRHNHCPRLHIRRARVEDHDDLTNVLAEQSMALEASYGPYFLAELIEAQDETNHVAICEVSSACTHRTTNIHLLDAGFTNMKPRLGSI
uniref:Cilia- and flagella-associated protein 61 N-terminal domain-containing protein n=1 Tax=Electrophorus electricus TaxID=8005 RepID=A0A4W4F6L4_ELEEL